MKALATLVLLLLVEHAYSANTTIVNSCNDATLPEVKFSSNNTVCAQGPCIVKPGDDLNLDIYFRSPKYLENIKPKIIASALGIKIDYPLFQDDACVGILNTNCPLVADEFVEYAYTMHLLDIFPEAAVGLTFTLVDKDDNSDVVCFSVDIELKKT